MYTVPDAEQLVGMELYTTGIPGFGGHLKRRFDDFVVEEIPTGGPRLSVRPWEPRPCGPPAGDPKARYVHFTLQKRGLSTLDVAMILASELGIPHHLVMYAGIKDKRAVTVQRMCVPARCAAQLVQLRLPNIMVSDPCYSRTPLRSGDLWGNHFRIRVRGIEVPCSEALQCVEALRDVPLLNYYGVQRFGVTRPYTHLVGKALVLRDYEAAVRAMLTTTNSFEPPGLTDVRLRLSERLAPTESMLAVFPKDMRHERTVLHYLIRHPGAFEKALRRIPSRIRTLFVHSYQSFLFNRIISRRAAVGAPLVQPVPGDFIVEARRAHAGRDSWRLVTDQSLEECRSLVLSGDYVLAAPVPGYATKLPPSWQSDMVREVLDEEGILLAQFHNSRYRAHDTPGGLHPVTMRPEHMVSYCEGDVLVVEFALQKGSYATVVLRELMKNHPVNRV